MTISGDDAALCRQKRERWFTAARQGVRAGGDRKDGGDPVNRADKEVAGEARDETPAREVYLVNWRQLTERACDWLPGATHERDTREKAPRRVSFSYSRVILTQEAAHRRRRRRRFLSLGAVPISATSFIRERALDRGFI